MRDALSLLDLCLTGSEAVTVPAVMERAGLVGREHLFRFAQAAFKNDGGEALRLLEGLWEKSVDYQRLCEQLIGFYRDLMVAKAVPKPEELITCLPDELKEFKAMAKAAALDDILAALNILQDSLARMSRSSQRRTELEMGLLRLCSIQKGQDTSEKLAARMDKLEKTVRELPEALPAGKPAPKHETAPTAEEISKTPVHPFERWPEVLEILRETNAALYGTLVKSKAYTGGDFMLVESGNSVFANMVRQDSYAKASLRDAAEQITGKKYKLGPYNSEKYEVKADTGAELDNILQKAAENGVDVIINN
jgi:DNA polymerase-3 subunit gamma/tau